MKKLPKGAIKTALTLFATLLVYENVVAPAAGKIIAKAKGGNNV